MNFLVKLLLNTLALLLVVKLVPGIRIAGWQTAVWAALGLGFVNAVIRPVIMLLTLPLNVMTLGLLTFVINALLFYSVTMFVPGFTVSDLVTAFFGSILYSMVSSLLGVLALPGGFRISGSRYRQGSGKYKDAVDVEHRPGEE